LGAWVSQYSPTLNKGTEIVMFKEYYLRTLIIRSIALLIIAIIEEELSSAGRG